MATEYNLVVVVYEGPAAAREVFNRLDELQKTKRIDIKEAAVVTRGPDGKLRMSNLGFVGTGKGGVLGLFVGAVVAGAPLAGLVVGGLVGFARSGDRRRLRHLLDEDLRSDQSTLALVIKSADWNAVAEATSDYPGEIIMSQLGEEALAALEGIADADDVAEATTDSLVVE